VRTPVLNVDNYSVPFGQTLNVGAPGLLTNDIGHSLHIHIEVSWGQAISNPDPSDDASLFGNAAIRYGTPGGLKNRLGGFTYTPDPQAATVTSPNGRTVSIEGLAVYNG
jgi:hypothetical protein